MLRPRYALCDSPQRLSLPSATTLGDGFTHNLAASPPVRHKVAVSPYRTLGSQACQHSSVFFRPHCHFGEKTGHIMVETTAGGSCPMAGLLQRAIPGSTHSP